jgi:uncharacterized protein (DUF433 family)
MLEERLVPMNDRKPSSFGDYQWIVSDPDLLGGKLAVRGTRFSVSFILSCLAEGMSVEEIEDTYGSFPHEAIPEIMKVASQFLDEPHVVA